MFWCRQLVLHPLLFRIMTFIWWQQQTVKPSSVHDQRHHKLRSEMGPNLDDSDCVAFGPKQVADIFCSCRGSEPWCVFLAASQKQPSPLLQDDSGWFWKSCRLCFKAKVSDCLKFSPSSGRLESPLSCYVMISLGKITKFQVILSAPNVNVFYL